MEKTKKKNVATIVVLAMFLCLSMTMNVHAATKKLNKKRIILESGKTVTLKVIGSKKKVTWHSTNAKVAKVNKKGNTAGRSRAKNHPREKQRQNMSGFDKKRKEG